MLIASYFLSTNITSCAPPATANAPAQCRGRVDANFVLSLIARAVFAAMAAVALVSRPMSPRIARVASEPIPATADEPRRSAQTNKPEANDPLVAQVRATTRWRPPLFLNFSYCKARATGLATPYK